MTVATRLSLPMKLHLLSTEGLRRTQHCHVPLFLRTTKYTVKTIDRIDEYLQVMQLRHEVFQREFAKKRYCLRSDRDRYDRGADFLVAIDNESGRIVGCYRLRCSRFTSEFYSASEFDISEILNIAGTKVELSRACIVKDHRNGRVLNLLWRGIADYMRAVEARIFFGCGSVQTMDPLELMAIDAEIDRLGARCSEIKVPVLKKYQLQPPRGHAIDGRVAASTSGLPPLMLAYLKAGAVICSKPAIDKKFRCADYMMVLDTNNINPAHRERYVGH